MLSQPLWFSSFAQPYRRCFVLNSSRYSLSLSLLIQAPLMAEMTDQSSFYFVVNYLILFGFLWVLSKFYVFSLQSIRLCCLPVLHSMKIGFFWSNVFVGLFCFWTSFLYTKSKSLWIRNDPFFLIIPPSHNEFSSLPSNSIWVKTRRSLGELLRSYQVYSVFFIWNFWD